MSPSELADKVTEHDAVRRWRLHRLEAAGFLRSDALVLSGRPDVDIHAAAKLLQLGCPAETAIRILF